LNFLHSLFISRINAVSPLQSLRERKNINKKEKAILNDRNKIENRKEETMEEKTKAKSKGKWIRGISRYVFGVDN